jgi:hypothetical protein
MDTFIGDGSALGADGASVPFAGAGGVSASVIALLIETAPTVRPIMATSPAT